MFFSYYSATLLIKGMWGRWDLCLCGFQYLWRYISTENTFCLLIVQLIPDPPHPKKKSSKFFLTSWATILVNRVLPGQPAVYFVRWDFLHCGLTLKSSLCVEVCWCFSDVSQVLVACHGKKWSCCGPAMTAYGSLDPTNKQTQIWIFISRGCIL
jgi:hypothetical protein